jgi:hypothetical protein
MKIQLRLTKELCDRIRADLQRPHAFAAERVGFVSGRLGNQNGSERLLLFSSYHPVEDEQYIDDPRSGARINSLAIREAMQRILDTRAGAFHVHLHPFPGKPGLGTMDKLEIPKLVESFRATDRTLAHGILLLSTSSFASWVWLPGSRTPVEPDRSTIVGYPMQLHSTEDQ